MSRLPRSTACLVGAAIGLSSPGWADEGATAWRVFVADHAAPTVTAFDLEDPGTTWRFDLAGPARLSAVADGELIVAVQADEDQVDFLRSGIEVESHGDHADIEVGEPAAIGTLGGPRPVHVVSHGGEVAIAFDEGGYAAALDEAAVLRGQIEPERVPMNVAHHGFVAKIGEHYVSSVASEEPVEEDKLPPRVGVGTFKADGTPVGETHTCTDLHGEAFSGNVLSIGCVEGVIAYDAAGGPDAFKMLPYPADFPSDEKTGTLLGSKSMQMFLGNHGDDAVVVVDPTAEPHFTRVALPFRRVAFALDPARPQFGYILTEDGTLHRLNMISAEIEESLEATQPYSMDGHWSDPRPRMAVAGDRLVLTDPLDASLRVIELESFAEARRIEMEGMPYNVVAVGGSGLMH